MLTGSQTQAVRRVYMLSFFKLSLQSLGTLCKVFIWPLMPELGSRTGRFLWVQGHSGLHIEILSQKKKKAKRLDLIFNHLVCSVSNRRMMESSKELVEKLTVKTMLCKSQR